MVDDETNIVYDLKRGLEVGAFKVDAYDSPQEGINSFKPNLYELAILDIRMPGLNGFSIHRKMKEIDSPLTACFLSASEIDPEEFKKVFPSRSEGVKAIIRKPFATNDLLREIDSFMKISAQARTIPFEYILIVFDSPIEMIEQGLEFLKVGLMNDEDVMVVTDAMPIDAIREKIAKERNDVVLAKMELEGRISLRTFREWYTLDGKSPSIRNQKPH